jgi:hypothetical protein
MEIHHFGDSYCLTNIGPNFCQIMAENIGYQYSLYGVRGYSNEQILNSIIKNLHKFKSGDKIFINFSFFTRGCWYDNKTKSIQSLNRFYNDIEKTKTNLGEMQIQKIISLIDYYLINTEDNAKKLFTIIDSIFQYIEKLGIKIFYIFVDEYDWSDELLNNGINIKFKNGFGFWLKENNFHLDTDGHYTKGIQDMLADIILKKTNNLEETINKKINIDIKEVNLGLIIKSTNLI